MSVKLTLCSIVLICCTPLCTQAAALPDTAQANLRAKLDTPLVLTVGNQTYPVPSQEVALWLQETPALTVNPAHRTEIENVNLCQLNTDSTFCDLLFNVSDELHLQSSAQVTINSSEISKFLADLGRQVDKDPVDAKFQVTNGTVTAFSLSADGFQLDQDKSLQAIVSYLAGPTTAASIPLASTETKPQITSDSVANLGITTLIGEGVSNFVGSPQNRVFNIRVGASRFNGVLIKPGEEFSFIKTLGPVDAEHGYLPELVILQNTTEPEFGGGICQVSTTAFRAAVYSGLKITSRRNHAYPVSYYNPQGFDATVYIPQPDLRFINNTPGYILIQTKIEGTQLTFDFYGTSDGRKVQLNGPTILEHNPDGSMKTTLEQKVYTSTGNILLDDIFNSNYASPNNYPHPGQVLTVKPAGWTAKQWKAYQKAH